MSNSDFYIVSATVIPVFFLALTLQGKQFDDAEQLMRKLNHSVKKHLDQIEQDIAEGSGSLASLKALLPALASTAIWIVATGLLVFSILGEVFAILPLYQGKADPGTRPLVLIAVLGLTIGVGLLLYIRLRIIWGTTIFIFLRSDIRIVRLLVRRDFTDEDPHQQDPQDRHAGD